MEKAVWPKMAAPSLNSLPAGWSPGACCAGLCCSSSASLAGCPAAGPHPPFTPACAGRGAAAPGRAAQHCRLSGHAVVEGAGRVAAGGARRRRRRRALGPAGVCVTPGPDFPFECSSLYPPRHACIEFSWQWKYLSGGRPHGWSQHLASSPGPGQTWRTFKRLGCLCSQTNCNLPL